MASTTSSTIPIGDPPASVTRLTADWPFQQIRSYLTVTRSRSVAEPSGIDRFELGRPSRIYYGSGGGTNNPDDAAAELFGNTLNSVYIQDEIFVDQPRPDA